jgi:hypothetical protein
MATHLRSKELSVDQTQEFEIRAICGVLYIAQTTKPYLKPRLCRRAASPHKHELLGIRDQR